MTTNKDEGYIKFKYDWIPATLPKADMDELIYWRQKLYDAKLIGAYPNGIGYGNISQRYQGNQFIISASATGNIAKTDASHFALVDDFDLAKNWLSCIGNLPASSESLSHAAIYQTLPEVNAIVHIHHSELWNKYLNNFPTSNPEAAFGTPDLAFSVIDLIKKEASNKNIIVMGGHEEGILAFHKSMKLASECIIHLLDKLNEK